MLCVRLNSGILGYKQRVAQISILWKHFSYVKSTPDSKSFVTDLFLGKFNNDVFLWPESSEISRLERQLYPVEKYFRGQVRSADIDVEEMIPLKTLDDLKNLNLFGLTVPPQYSGLGLSMKEYCVFREVMSGDRSIDEFLFSHELLGLQGILISGSEQQKEEYLPKLAKGEWVAALAVSESDLAFDASAITTRATLSEDRQSWSITGKKKWVVNAPLASIYTVLALTEKTSPFGKKQDVYTAFLVEKDFGGITISEPVEKLGLNGVSVCEVTFEDTVVPLGNVLGKVGSGLELVKNIFNNSRYSAGCPVSGLLRKLVNITTKFGIRRLDFGADQGDFKLGHRKLAEATCMAYAMESVTYMTAFIMDAKKYSSFGVESAVVKVFSLESLWSTLHSLQEVFGSMSYDESFPFERIFRDSYTLLIPDESTDSLKLWIGLAGLQCAGRKVQGKIEKLRNILHNPTYILELLFMDPRRRPQVFTPTSGLDLGNHLHDSLGGCALQLKRCIHILQTLSESLLTDYGAEVVEHKLTLMKLADIAICIYAMSAVLGRASYSLSNSITDSVYEVYIVELICSSAFKKVMSIELEIQKRHVEMADRTYRSIAQKLFLKKEYFLSHPLERNF